MGKGGEKDGVVFCVGIVDEKLMPEILDRYLGRWVKYGRRRHEGTRQKARDLQRLPYFPNLDRAESRLTAKQGEPRRHRSESCRSEAVRAFQQA